MKQSFLSKLTKFVDSSNPKVKRVRNLIVFFLVSLGPFLAVLTYLGMGPLNLNPTSEGLRMLIVLDVSYILVVATLIVRRIARLISERRQSANGAQLHLRLASIFSIIALVPTILVAVFATITVNFGLEGWFSEKVRLALGSSLSAAESYQLEKENSLVADVNFLAGYILRAKLSDKLLGDSELREILSRDQEKIQRGLKEAFIIDGSGNIKARGEKSYLFDFERLSTENLKAASNGETVLIKDWKNDELRVLLKLTNFPNRFLYVSRAVDGNFLQLLDETKDTVMFYRQLENDRDKLLFEFGILYFGFAVILILSATWAGFWFAERLSRPIGNLAYASKKIGLGDLSIRVPETAGNDEISVLGRSFNQMTSKLGVQREELLNTTDQIEKRRILFDSVLSSVSTGVIGLNSEGETTFINKSALSLLDTKENNALGLPLEVLVPEFLELFKKTKNSSKTDISSEMKVTRRGKLENLLVRTRARVDQNKCIEGYVIVFDDVTELVSAQKMAAWGDVARRIAHEIKNPLTPIKLSAERLYKKLLPLVGDEKSALKQYTDMIIRQTNDIQRIVDDFSKFARMPEPDRRKTSLSDLIKDITLLQQSSFPDISIIFHDKTENKYGLFDVTMIGQVFTNLIKNAGEAIYALINSESYVEKDYKGEIIITLKHENEGFVLSIRDNGIGLPENHISLFEPYVTTRKGGTGLGLSIVKNIIEQHGGNISLQSVGSQENSTGSSTEVVVILPHLV